MTKILAVFHKSFAHAPPELKSPVDRADGKHPEQILRDFHSSHTTSAFSASFSGGAALASATADAHHFSLHQR